MTTMRAKFLVTKINPLFEAEELVFSAVSDKPFDEGGNSEDNSFAKYTPSGTLTMVVNNPNLKGKLVVGEKYYLDFTKAE